MGAPGPYRDAVLFNAAGALRVAKRGQDWHERVAIAAEALDSGAAHGLLERWIAMAV
jgi:anthranilate phosphoribosyltransferase